MGLMTRTSMYRLVPSATTSASLIGHRGRVTMAPVNGFFITVNSQNLKFISIDFINPTSKSQCLE